MHRNSNTFRILLAVAVLLSLTVGMVAALPLTQNITYQGKLTDAAGKPLTGDYSVTFKLYEVASGDSALATDTHTVTAAKGLFTTQITAAPALFDGRALWLGIKVGTDPEMTPRQELRPVPYALSLRPGSWITSNDGSSALTLQNKGSGRGLNVFTSSSDSTGVYASTSGMGSYGVMAITSNSYSPGVYASTVGSYSEGFYAETRGTDSPGVSVDTSGGHSPGVSVTTRNTSSKGFQAETLGAGSPGVTVNTEGDYSNGVIVTTDGINSEGVTVSTYGTGSEGVYATTSGSGSPAIYANAKGVSSYGATIYSNQSSAIYASTSRLDSKYGIYTPDYLYAKGTQVPAADVAEYMPVTGSMTPGTVLIIGSEGKLQTTATAYDTRVAGIVSTEPGMSLGTREDGNPGEALIAVAGRVPCKVDASSAPVHAGDLLTTSDNPGYAMKAELVNIGGIEIYRPSTILGKAMGNLETGTGTIEVLVTLQ